MNKIENKEFSDQHERLSLSSKIDQQLDALKNKSEGLLEQAEQKVFQDVLKDTITELEWQEKNPDELLEHEDATDIKKNSKSFQNSIPFNVQKNIEEKIGNENPLANQWRVESYTNVSNFATTVAQQWWLLGKLASWFS